MVTTPGISGNQALRYVSITFSVFSEYLLNTTLRVRNAAFSALRLILSQSLRRDYFNDKTQQSTTDALALDMMSLGEEIQNMRRGEDSKNLSNGDKLIIHLRYLLTSRFEESQDLALKLMKTFIQRVGSALKSAGDLLVAVSQIKVAKESYKSWISCIGSFLIAAGC